MPKLLSLKFSLLHLLLLICACSVLVACFASYWHASREIVGKWKGVDEYGGVHFYEFSADGTMKWWDLDPNKDGSYSKRGPFQATYERQEDQFLLKQEGLHTLGTLTLLSRNRLRQDFQGHSMRMNLIYNREKE